MHASTNRIGPSHGLVAARLVASPLYSAWYEKMPATFEVNGRMSSNTWARAVCRDVLVEQRGAERRRAVASVEPAKVHRSAQSHGRGARHRDLVVHLRPDLDRAGLAEAEVRVPLQVRVDVGDDRCRVRAAGSKRPELGPASCDLHPTLADRLDADGVLVGARDVDAVARREQDRPPRDVRVAAADQDSRLVRRPGSSVHARTPCPLPAGASVFRAPGISIVPCDTT